MTTFKEQSTAPTKNQESGVPEASTVPFAEEQVVQGSAGDPPIKQDHGARTIDVIAPSDLSAGYQFYVDDPQNAYRSLLVEVPPGGVRATQRFAAIVLREVNRGSHNIPSGRWRDDLCDCFRFGCCHPQCCLTFWCEPCALGQVLTRLKLNWCARPVTLAEGALTAFQILFALWTVYLIVTWSLNIVVGVYQEEDSEDSSKHMWDANENDPDWLISIRIIRNVLDLALFITIFLITMFLRQHIRNKYSIPETCCCCKNESSCCSGWEDCCCSFWCQPCTICQMARHTADYHTYSAGCCTEDGLAPGAPAVV